MVAIYAMDFLPEVYFCKPPAIEYVVYKIGISNKTGR